MPYTYDDRMKLVAAVNATVSDLTPLDTVGGSVIFTCPKKVTKLWSGHHADVVTDLRNSLARSHPDYVFSFSINLEDSTVTVIRSR